MNGIGKVAFVDRHDAGASQVNIFLLTNDPKQAFREIRRVREAGIS
jgi:hypothetical protein